MLIIALKDVLTSDLTINLHQLYHQNEISLFACDSQVNCFIIVLIALVLERYLLSSFNILNFINMLMMIIFIVYCILNHHRLRFPTFSLSLLIIEFLKW
jgi:hypothetical protein